MVCLATFYGDKTRLMMTRNFNWQQITKTLSHSVFLIREDASFIYVNDHACEKLKYSREEMLTKSLFDIVPRYQNVHWPDAWQQFKLAKASRFESSHCDRDGRKYPVLVNVNYNKDDGDEPFLIAHTIDISESIRTRRQLSLAIASAQVGFWELDLRTGAVFVSSQLHRQLGQSDDTEWTLDLWKELLHPDDFQRSVACVEDFQSGRSEEYLNVFRLRHADGSYRWIESRGQFSHDDSGTPIRMVGTHLDITHQKTIEEEVRQMLRRSESVSKSLARSNRDLEQFAYVASHDLRAPLRALTNLVEWVREDAADAKIELPQTINGHLEKIQAQVLRMDALLSGLLEYSRASNRTHMQRSVDLHSILDDAVKLAAVPPGFTVVLPEQSPQWTTVREMLIRIFQNLIDNAVKHHDREQGTITIGCEESADEFVFSVKDDGPGIEDKYRERVFEIFQKLKRAQNGDGAGLGLTIVQKLVQTAGGEIEIQSADPRGTEFRFRWPKKLDQLA
jgi:protein-histidine pros-kinase